MSKDLVTTPDVRLLDQFGRYIEGRVPTDRATKPLRRLSPTYIDASSVDAEIVHNILTNADVGDARQVLALYDQIVYSDNHIQGELSKRKLAVLGDPLTVTAKDPKNPDDVRAAAMAQEQLDEVTGFFDARSHLLDSCLWPVTLVEKVYRRSSKPGVKFDLSELIAVPHFVLYLDPTGPLRVFDVGEDGTVYGTHKMADPMRYVVHRAHLLGDRDHRGGPMRSLVFWWLFGAFDRDWWIRFLDRYGTPFPVGKYDQADDEARSILMSAFSLASRLGGLVISNETEVELLQAQTQSAGEAFKTFHDTAQAEKSKLIVGQTTSATATAAGGLGSGIGKAQSEVRSDIRVFDQLRLADTIEKQMVIPFLQINRIPGRVKVTIGAEDTEDTGETCKALSDLHNAGVELSDDGITALSVRFGLTLRRSAVPTTPPPESPQSGRSVPPHLATFAAAITEDPRVLAADRANARVARAGAADLALAFRGDLAPIQKLLSLSTDAADFERRLLDTFPDYTPTRTVPFLEAALTAFAANGVTR